MRNTFIHIESVPVVERIVQSMPDGMFRQCLNAELSAQHIGIDTSGAIPDDDQEDSALEGSVPLTGPLLTPPHSASPAPLAYAPPQPPPAPAAAAPSCPPPQSEPAGQFIALGTEVIIQNLVKLPAFNGLTGVVQSLDAPSGRYDVLLADPAGASGWRWVKVKGDNLIVKVPPPPRNAPTILLEDCILPEEASEADPPPATEGVPPTPTWDEWDEDGKAKTAPLKLNSLV
jgi:hypothetical protein